ncbi:MAG TPA: hypothetical protein VFV66_32170 [Nonomuraea sp.]|nr:hypothetical protein [Nonomuraea sp.]
MNSPNHDGDDARHDDRDRSRHDDGDRSRQGDRDRSGHDDRDPSRRVRRHDRRDDEFFAPVLREPPPPPESGQVSDTGVPDVAGAGRGGWARSPEPSSGLGVRLLAVALALLAGVVLAVLAVLAGRPLLAVPPAVVALAAGAYLVAFGVRRSRSDGGPPTFG